MIKNSTSLLEKYNREYNRSLLEKWGREINVVRKVYTDFSDIQAINLATLCENTQAEIEKYKKKVSLGEATQTTDVGPYIRHAFEIITALVPNLVAEEVVSIQALNQKIGQIFFLKYVYGSNKGTVRRGDVAFGPYEVASNPDYSSEYVDQEILGEAGETSYSGNLQWGPVLPGKVVISCGLDTATDVPVTATTGTFTGSTFTGTINYETGAYTLTFGSAATAEINAAYEYNLSFAPAEVPEFDLQVTEKIVIARPRKLRARYAFDAAYDIEKQFGLDIDKKLLEASIGEIKHEIDQEILNDLYRGAGLNDTWNDVKPNGVSQEEHYRTFITAIIRGGNKIFSATKRATGNRLIVGLNGATVIESLPQFIPVDSSDKIGAHVIGTIKGQIKVIKNPFYGDDDYLIAYKGDNFLDAGYVYAPYLPVFATQLVMLDDFVGRRGYATSYAKVLLNANYYVKGKITHIPDNIPVTATLANTAANPIYTNSVINSSAENPVYTNTVVTNTDESPVKTKEVQG